MTWNTTTVEKMHHNNEKSNNYLVRLHNYLKVKEECNGSLTTRVFQEHGMKIIYQLHATGFVTLSEYDKKEAETAGEEMLCAII